MLKILLILFVFWMTMCFVPVQGMAADEWSKRDIWAELAWQGLWAVDYLQTRTIAKNPDRYWEANPLLTRHPSVTKVDAYFLTLALLHLFITDRLPKEHRPIWQILSITTSVVLMVNNFSIGIKIKF